jgi:hypothetical protein
MKTYKGKYKPVNIEKYIGNANDIVYRSGWERYVCKWCDSNSKVVAWSSETVIVPYVCGTDNRVHRYFVDFLVKFEDGKTILVEVKPKIQTIVPVNKPGKKKRVYINEATTYVKNMSKWEAATEYAKDRGFVFQIWTEDTLTQLGIMPKSTQKQPGKLKKLKPYKPFNKGTKKKV